MNSAIILSGFGTSSKAIATFDHLEQAVASHFPDHLTLRSFSSRQLDTILRKRGESHTSLEQTICQLKAQGCKDIVVQSLHLFPGKEFHNLVRRTHKQAIDCKIGMPLLTLPEDYLELANLLAAQVESLPDCAILLLGHGTDHPTWTSYHALEKVMRERFGPRIFVGVVEKYPESKHLVTTISAAGHKKVLILPLFLFAGMHFARDIAAPTPTSWRSRLLKAGRKTELCEQGIAELKSIHHLVIRHILEAQQL